MPAKSLDLRVYRDRAIDVRQFIRINVARTREHAKFRGQRMLEVEARAESAAVSAQGRG